MNKLLISLFFAFTFIAAPALAEKPGWAGDGKPSLEERKAHTTAMDAKASVRDNAEEGKEKAERIKTEKDKTVKNQHEELKELEEEESKKNKAEKEKNVKKQKSELKGLEKQKAKKSEQIQNELDKGSEKGQEARKERRKWWKFWGESE